MTERDQKVNLIIRFKPFLPPAHRFSMDDVRITEFVKLCMRHIFGYEGNVKLLAQGVSHGLNENPWDAKEKVYDFKVPDMTVQQACEVHRWMDGSRNLLQDVGQPANLHFHAFYGPEPV